jgi:hypothetical protein
MDGNAIGLIEWSAGAGLPIGTGLMPARFDSRPLRSTNFKEKTIMKLNGFQITINGKSQDNGLVPMRHCERYKIGMHNSGELRCDARVEVDGKEIGTFRINGFDSASIERPPNDRGCFTFYKEGSSEAAESGISTGDEKNGLVSVTFMPEKRRIFHPTQDFLGEGAMRSFGGGMKGMSSGGTGLSGHSSQNFSSVASLDYDNAKITTIHVRLFCVDEKNDPRPLRSLNETAIPERVD